MSDALHTSAQTPSEQKSKYRRLTSAQISAILHLRRAGKTQTEIAQAVGCAVSNVHEWLERLEDRTDLAKVTLKNGAQRLAERAIKKANVDQSLEMLDRLEVLTKRDNGGSGRTNIAIVVGMPGKPAGGDPFGSQDVCTATVIESDSVRS